MGWVGSLFKVTGKTFLDVPSWIGYQNIKSYTRFLWGLVTPAFKVPKKQVGLLSFEEFVKQNGITEEDLKKRIQGFVIYFFVYVIGLVGSLAYAFYLFWGRYLVSGLIAVIIALIFFLQALSMHFFYFQVKHRKLGCTFKEWLSGRINDTSM